MYVVAIMYTWPVIRLINREIDLSVGLNNVGLMSLKFGVNIPVQLFVLTVDQANRSVYRVGQKKRGHSTFCRISRKLLKIFT